MRSKTSGGSFWVGNGKGRKSAEQAMARAVIEGLESRTLLSATTVAAGDSQPAVVTLSTISGTVYIDSNKDLIDDNSELGIQGVTMTLTGLDFITKTQVNATTLTDAQGNYSFSGLNPNGAGGYTVTETPPSGYVHEGQTSDQAAAVTTPSTNPAVSNIQLGLGSNITTSTEDFAELLPPIADVSVSVTDNGGGSVNPGNSFGYKIVVTNNGPDTAQSVLVSDAVPAGISSFVWSGDGQSNVSGAISDTIASLASGGSTTYTVNATVAANANGEIENTAAVSSPTKDNNLANNSFTDFEQVGLVISTNQLPGSAVVGVQIADNATLAGGNSPTGTVTFNLYDNPSATGSPVFTDTETLSNMATEIGSISSAPSGATESGTTATITTISPLGILPGETVTIAGVGVAGYDGTFTVLSAPSGGSTFTFTDGTSGLANSGGGTVSFSKPELPTATSVGFTTSAPGTYYWVDTYNADSNNAGITSGDAAEPVVISQATPEINTTQEPANSTVGIPFADQATVSGGDSPGGTVTFNLYDNSTGSGTALFTDTEMLSGGTATSHGYTPTAAGTDYWVATYNGDGNNASVPSGTASEPVTVNPAITLSPFALPGDTVNVAYDQKISASGGTGSISLAVSNVLNPVPGLNLPTFGTANLDITGTPTATGTETFTVTATDAVGATEMSIYSINVSAAPASIDTSQEPASANVGASIADKATISGGNNPTGLITFKLYNNPNAMGSPVFTDTEALSDLVTVNGMIEPGVVGATESGVTATITTTAPLGITPGEMVTVAGVGVAAYNGTFTVTSAPSGGSSFSYVVGTSGLANSGGGTVSLSETVEPTATSKGFTTTAPGTYYWVDSYGGDTNNEVVTSGNAAEPVVISAVSVSPQFSKLHDETITIHNLFETFTGKIAAGSMIPSGHVTVTLNGITQNVTIKSDGTFSVTFKTVNLGVGAYSVTYAFAGNSQFSSAMATSTLDVTYGIRVESSSGPFKAGSTDLIAFLLKDAFGNDVNTKNTTVHATGLALASSPNNILSLPAGNPAGGKFTPDKDGDYFSLNLKTTGLAAGQYVLYFTVTGDPVRHSIVFTIKK